MHFPCVVNLDFETGFLLFVAHIPVLANHFAENMDASLKYSGFYVQILCIAIKQRKGYI
jgi:hypothetical protein